MDMTIGTTGTFIVFILVLLVSSAILGLLAHYAPEPGHTFISAVAIGTGLVGLLLAIVAIAGIVCHA